MLRSRARLSFFEKRLDKWRNTVYGAKLIPRKEHRDLLKKYTEENQDDPFKSTMKKQTMKFKNPNAFYQPEDNEDNSLAGFADNRKTRSKDPVIKVFGKEFKDPLQKWYNDRQVHEENEFMKYIEFQYRGWIKPELTRALFIQEYGHIKDRFGTAANLDPFRHFQQDVIEVGHYKWRSKDPFTRRLKDNARDSQAAFAKIHAASINPMDYWISQGHAHQFLEEKRIGYNRATALSLWWQKLMPNFDDKEATYDAMRLGKESEGEVATNPNPSISVFEDHRFPLVLGRDFCGTLEDVGGDVGSAQVGDRIWGVRPLHDQGTFTDYRQLKAHQFGEAPSNLSNEECAAIPFVGVTLLCGFDKYINKESMEGKKVLVIGGAGGSGSIERMLNF